MAEPSAAIAGMLTIEVCHAPAPPQPVVLLTLAVPAGTTLRNAVMRSGILEQLPGVDPEQCKCGIWGKLKPPDTLLRDRDRIELYRPLIADPKEARRRRARKKSA